MADLFDVIVVQVKEYQVREADQVFYFGDKVVLQVQQPEPFLPLKERHMRELSLVELQSFGIGRSLTWLSIDHKHARYLGQLGKYDFVVVFYLSDDAVRQQVSISFIVLRLMKS